MNLTKIIKNSLFHFVAKAIGMAIGLLSIALITRYLGQKGFGQYATAFAWLQFAGIFVDFGLYMVLLAELGKNDDKQSQEKTIANLLALRLVTALFVFSLAIAIAWFTAYALIIKLAISVLAIALLMQSVNQMLTGLFQYKMKMKTGGLVEVIGKILSLFFLLIVIYKNLNLVWLVGSISLAGVLNTLLMLKLANNFFRIRLEFDFSYWKKLIILAWPLAVAGIFNIFYFKADTLILSWYQPMNEVGLYSAPYRLLEVMISLPPLFLGLVMPKLSQLWQEKDKLNLEKSIKQSLNIFHLFIIPASVGIFMLAEPIMIFISGEKFAASGFVLQLLIIATLFIFYSQLLAYIIVAINKQKQVIKYIALAAIVALILYFVFIPKYSYLAAALITIAVEGFVMLTYLYLVKKYIKFKIVDKNLVKIIISSIIMALVIYTISYMPLLLILLIAILVYGLAIFLTKTRIIN